jgi:hypothetical protein
MQYKKSKQLMSRSPVCLTIEQRQLAMDELLKSFAKRQIEVIALSVDRIHFHLLARFPDRNPRHHIGIAKKESSHYLKQQGHAPAGGLWGTRTQCVPIRNRPHQLTVFRYILAHSQKGGATWRIKRNTSPPQLQNAPS